MQLNLSALLPARPEEVYTAWLSSHDHGAFTGGRAEIDPRPGGAYTAWDGYIRGETLELEPPRLIHQTWRTTEFPADCPDSDLVLLLEKEGEGTLLTLIHTAIPEGQAEMYREGWEEYYFKPMQAWFAGQL